MTVSADGELQLSVQPLHLVKNDLIPPLGVLRCRGLRASDDLAAETLGTSEDVQRICESRPGRRGDQTIEQDEVGREPAVARDIPVTGRSRIVPAQRVGRMQAMPLFPRCLELPFGRKDSEVHVAELVGLTAGEGAQQHNAEERSRRSGLSELYESRPLTQKLGCAPTWPIVDVNHETRIFAYWVEAPHASGLLPAGVRAAVGEQTRSSRLLSAPMVESLGRVSWLNEGLCFQGRVAWQSTAT
jgi:hypothetical protein